MIVRDDDRASHTPIIGGTEYQAYDQGQIGNCIRDVSGRVGTKYPALKVGFVAGRGNTTYM